MYVVKFPNLYDFSALQQVSKIFCSIGYVTNKSIKITAKSSSKNIFRWIFAYLYFAFDNVLSKIKKTWKKYFKKRSKT